MNDLFVLVRSTDRSGQELLDLVVEPDARISPLDRVWLHLGLWLLRRGERRVRLANHRADQRRARRHSDHARILARRHIDRERESAIARAQFGRLPFL